MRRFFFIVFLLNAAFMLTLYAQDNTKAGLPEGAIARLGKGGINLMRFSPDGTHLAVGTDVGVWLYDVATAEETALFTGHTGQVNALAFSTDGKTLASGGLNSPIIQLWDVETKSKLSPLKLTEKYESITALTFSENNTRLISLDRRGKITHWDANTCKRLRNRSRSVDSYDVVTVSQDGTIFATGNRQGRIYLFDSTTGGRLASFRGHARLLESLKAILGLNENPPQDEDVRGLAFSSDAKMLLSCGEDKTVQAWNIAERSKHATFKGHKDWITAVALSADGKTAVSGDAGKVIKLWDVSKRRERATLSGHSSTINALTFMPDNAALYAGCLVSGSADGTIRFWNPDTGKELLTFTTGYTESVKAVAFAENGATLASVAFNGVVEMWDIKTAQTLGTFTKAESDLTVAVAFSHDATRFACQGASGATAFYAFGGNQEIRRPKGNVQLWDITTGELIPGPWQNADSNANALAFSPDNRILVAGFGGQGIRAWDLNDPIELFHFDTAAPFFGRQFTFSPTGTLIATNGTHVQTHIWDIDTHAEITPPNIQKVSALAFSPGGILLAHGHHRDGIVLWHVTPTGIKEHSRIPKSQRAFSDVLTFSPDGKILLDPQFDMTRNHIIKLWDVETGAKLKTLTGHTASIETLVFSHDKKILASGSDDGTVLLWDWDKISTEGIPGNR